MQYSTTSGAQGICPSGWHIPTYEEYQTLNSAVNKDGSALKAVGQGSGNGAGTNTSGFSALLAGFRSYGGGFHELLTTFFWISTEFDTSKAYNLLLYKEFPTTTYLGTNGKDHGFSVRCIKD